MPDSQVNAVKAAASLRELILALKGVNKFLDDHQVIGTHKNELTHMIQFYSALR